MTLQEAIRSGKRFRRTGSTVWIYIGAHGHFHYTGGHEAVLIMNDILADDWEIEEKSVTVTESQLREACTKAFKDMKADHNSFYAFPTMHFNYMCKRIGLRDQEEG